MRESVRHVVVHSAHSRHASFESMMEERAGQNPLTRLSKIGVYKTLGAYISRSLENHSKGTLVGVGGEQIVLKSWYESSAIKVLISTMGIGRADAGVRAARLQELSDRCAQYIGNSWAETSFYPTTLPRLLGGRAIVAVQEYISSEKISPISQGLDDMKDVSLQMRALSEKILALYADFGIMPDLEGANNLVMVTGPGGNRYPLFLDTIPKSRADLAKIPDERLGSKLEAFLVTLGQWASDGAGGSILWTGSQPAAVR